jgi:outer membrane lipoprotein SlyB
MQCSNCGKTIPFAGKVCPFCHVEKSGDQRRYAYAVLGAVTCGAAGGFVFGLWGIVGGLVVGAISGSVAGSKAKK